MLILLIAGTGHTKTKAIFDTDLKVLTLKMLRIMNIYNTKARRELINITMNGYK